MKQTDFFQQPAQDELFEDGPRENAVRANPEEVRAELLQLLAQARAAQTMPWDARELGYHQLVFPQMSRWLPADEAAQLCFEFEAEVKRLLAA